MRFIILIVGLCAVLTANLSEGSQLLGAPLMQQGIAKVDLKKVAKFCDVGFRFTKNGINFDIQKLISLGLDPKVMQAVSSQAAFYVTDLTYLCRMMAAGFITPERYLAETTKILEYAKALETVRVKAEETTKTPVSKKPDPRLDAAEIAKVELDLKIESSIDVGGELHVVLRTLVQRYACLCQPEQKE